MAEVGDTKQLTFEHPSGRTAMLMLRGRLPFLLVKTTIRNAQAEPLVLDEVVPMLASIDLDLPARDLRLLGYDGLARPIRRRPATCLAAANPTTGISVTLAYDARRASGLIRATTGETRCGCRRCRGISCIQPGDTAVGGRWRSVTLATPAGLDNMPTSWPDSTQSRFDRRRLRPGITPEPGRNGCRNLMVYLNISNRTPDVPRSTTAGSGPRRLRRHHPSVLSERHEDCRRPS